MKLRITIDPNSIFLITDSLPTADTLALVSMTNAAKRER
jgi:hypothetical protein